MTEERKRLYEYRKANNLCVECGDTAKPGKTRCIGCLQYQAVMSRMRWENYTPAEKKRLRQMQKKWREDHPERMEVYKSRKSEYNRRYRDGY